MRANRSEPLSRQMLLAALERHRALIAASVHDLRQPLQALVLLQARLVRMLPADEAQALLLKVDAALTMITAQLNALSNASASDAHKQTVLASPDDDMPDQPAIVLRAAIDGQPAPLIFLIDDDDNIRDELRRTLVADGYQVQAFASCEGFAETATGAQDGCLLVDAYLPGMSGLDLLRQLQRTGRKLPAIMITGNSDVQMAVAAMKAGALDFLEKPIFPDELRACIQRALEQSRDQSKLLAWRTAASDQLAGLTVRQQEIMQLVLAGHPSKNIAADLGISQRTVENHRAVIMKKTGSKSLPALARLAVAAAAPRA